MTTLVSKLNDSRSFSQVTGPFLLRIGWKARNSAGGGSTGLGLNHPQRGTSVTGVSEEKVLGCALNCVCNLNQAASLFINFTLLFQYMLRTHLPSHILQQSLEVPLVPFSSVINTSLSLDPW